MTGRLSLLGGLSFSAGCVFLLAAPALAQIKPMHSGHMSHGAAQMRADAGGLHHPNRPSHHHHRGYPGYRHHPGTEQ